MPHRRAICRGLAIEPSEPKSVRLTSAASCSFLANFFVAAVRHDLPALKDAALQRKARLCCGQEGMHTREHVHYNRRLGALGYPAAKLERWAAAVLWFVRMTSPPRIRLAITCAIEHFTAIGAASGLQELAFSGADPRMRAFWRWHAAEEIEHKAIPFDIYHAVGGSYLERVLTMFVTTIVFRTFATLYWLCFIWVDGLLFSRKPYRELGVLLSSSGRRGFIRNYFSYYKPSFHPWQLDDRRELARFHGELQQRPVYEVAAR
jgi:predicted metal-dependent hydrolase